MCYRCEVCSDTVPPGRPLRKHAIHRDVYEERLDKVAGRYVLVARKEIAAELPVCDGCGSLLDAGVPYNMLRSQGGKARRVS
jgi:hypothetical protein